MNQQHQLLSEYASPVVRVPSPASSLGTTYGRDQTSFSDTEFSLGQQAFERKWENKIGIRDPRPEEAELDQGPLIFRPIPGSEGEKSLVKDILDRLRRHVQELVENEMFEQALLKGSQIGFEHQPMTQDLDAIMRTMMPGIANSPQHYSNNSNISNGPWMANESRHTLGGGIDYSGTETTVGSRRKSRGGGHKV